MLSVSIFLSDCGFVDNVGPLGIQSKGLLKEKKRKGTVPSFFFFSNQGRVDIVNVTLLKYL